MTDKKCDCPECNLKPGQVYLRVMLGQKGTNPIDIGSISIDTNPGLMLEDKFLEKVVMDTAMQLINKVVEDSEDKVVN